KKIYFETPYLGTVVSGDFLSQSTSTNLIEDVKPVEIIFDIDANTNSNVQYIINRYDNIKITALKKVTQSVNDLGTHELLAKKFNIYPNPANNIVNITNNDNKLVNKIDVYDTTGKLINTQNYNNEAERQLNVEHLASGTYMLHIQTAEGTAVKKLVKK